MQSLNLKFFMETGLPTGSIMKYNFLLTLLLLEKLTLSFVSNAGHTYTMQELVKQVTLMDLQFCMDLFLSFLPRRYTEL